MREALAYKDIGLEQYLPRERKPFAFDLGREYELIGKYGEEYRKHFVANAEYYAKETYGKVPKITYEHDIERDSEGNVRLKFGLGEYAQNSYVRPAFDMSFPAWYRERSFADGKWVHALQDNLKYAKPGDMFVDLCPAEFDVSIEERKKWGFGWHSFARIHEYVIENGREKLVSRGLRNYLDMPEQEKLLTALTEKKVDGKFLLGSVGRLKPEIQIGTIDSTISELYKNTPEDRKISEPNFDMLHKSNEEMGKVLFKVRNWLDGIFYMMKNGTSKQEIQKQFRGWENAVKALTKEEFLDVSYFASINPRDFGLIKTAETMPIPIGFYVNQEYRPDTNGCGLGAGFYEGKFSMGGFIPNNRTSGMMDYKSMTLNENKRIFCCTCPFCKRKVEAVISAGKISCPECMAEANWSETASQAA